jgi:hypothetical protein
MLQPAIIPQHNPCPDNTIRPDFTSVSNPGGGVNNSSRMNHNF